MGGECRVDCTEQTLITSIVFFFFFSLSHVLLLLLLFFLVFFPSFCANIKVKIVTLDMLHTQHILFNQASFTPGICTEEQKTRKQNKDLKNYTHLVQSCEIRKNRQHQNKELDSLLWKTKLSLS